MNRKSVVVENNKIEQGYSNNGSFNLYTTPASIQNSNKDLISNRRSGRMNEFP